MLDRHKLTPQLKGVQVNLKISFSFHVEGAVYSGLVLLKPAAPLAVCWGHRSILSYIWAIESTVQMGRLLYI